MLVEFHFSSFGTLYIERIKIVSDETKKYRNIDSFKNLCL